MADKKGLINWSQFLENSGTHHNYKDQLIAQLEKDLGITFSSLKGSVIFSESHALVQKKAENQTLGELLYRIDLGEGKAQNCMQAESPIECLTKAILQREAQKVFFRIQYSSP